ncbi:MAG: STAS domain-containing protein [Geobacteraceae bacterium]|nr:STAS domain-containing protein [Geobacteraceae bacterium]
MTVRIDSTAGHEEDVWTISGLEENIDSLLLSLKQIENRGTRVVTIDCGQIDDGDTSRLQLLNVWMLCARLRGFEPKLVNLSDSLKQTIQNLELKHCV